MTTEQMFGIGRGHLGKRAASVAKKHGATLVNHTQPQCTCGDGCSPFECPRSTMHWFCCDNRGNPWDDDVATAVMRDLRALKIVK